MPKFPKSGLSKDTRAPDKSKKISKTVKITDRPGHRIKPRRTAKQMTTFSDRKNENSESIDSGYGESQPRVHHRYPTRARIAALEAQKNYHNQTKSLSAKPAKPKRYKKPSDVDKQNDGSAVNEARPGQGTSANKRRLSGLPVSRSGGSQNVAIAEELNSKKEQLSQCSSPNWRTRDIGLWIECTQKGCGKWRYTENYLDPLDVPKIWFCKMNTDSRFADCSIPQEEIPEAESRWHIENAYNAGSIAWAKVDGFPWWPAMVDYCPELCKYWDTRGSSIVPYRYHVKFFNELKIDWIVVRNLKPYVENPRSTFLKKTVYRKKDYSQELDAACELANQALRLSLLERRKIFSWAAQISGGLYGEARGSTPDECPAKKTKPTNKSHIDPRIVSGSADNAVPSPVSSSTKKKLVEKKARNNAMLSTKANVTENVLRQQMINIRSKIINAETDRPISMESSTFETTSVPIRSKINARRLDSGNQSPSCQDKLFYLESNEFFKDNSIDRSKIDNSNIDDVPVPRPVSKSTQSTHEKQKCTEEAYNPRCTTRSTIADIEALAQEIRNNRPLYAKKTSNFRATTQIAISSDPPLTLPSRKSSLSIRSGEKLASVDLRSRVDTPANTELTVPNREDRRSLSPIDIVALNTSRTQLCTGTKRLVESSWDPIEIDLTGSSPDFERHSNGQDCSDYANHAETRYNSESSNPTFASIANGSSASFGSIQFCGSLGLLALFSQPGWNEMAEERTSSCGLCELSEAFRDSDSNADAATCIEPPVSTDEEYEESFAHDGFAASTPRPKIYHSRSSSQSEESSSFLMNSVSFGIGYSRANHKSMVNFTSDGSKKASSFRINSTPFGEGFNRSGGVSNINFCDSGSETNFSAGRSEKNSTTDEDLVTSLSRDPFFIDLTDSATDFAQYYNQREYPNFLNHAETQVDSRSFDLRFVAPSNKFGSMNNARRLSFSESLETFRSSVLPSQLQWDEMVDQWDINDFSLPGILTRSCSVGSGCSLGTVVLSSQPVVDKAWEQRPSFPGLCTRVADSNASIYTLPQDIDVCSQVHWFSDRFSEVIVIDDCNIE